MPASKRVKTHADEFADLDDRPIHDFDPEDEQTARHSDSSSDDEAGSQDNAAATEHYETVGRSKLRQGRDPAALGPQYKGSRVSRTAAVDLDDDDSEDPFGAYGSDDESDVDMFDDEAEEDEEESDATSLDVDDDDDDDEDDDDGEDKGDERAELKRMMAQERKTTTAAVSDAVKQDAAKGRAVQAQRRAFDGLLNTRVQLQAALVAANTLPTLTPSPDADDTPALDAAELALTRLLSAMAGLRAALPSPSLKRKHAHLDPSTPLPQLWTDLQASESNLSQPRRAVLAKWSRRAHPASSTRPTPGKLSQSTESDTLLDVLDSQLADPAKLVARARVPRSSAPAQARARLPHSADVYDDAEMYGLLLKNLLEQRGAASSSSADAGKAAGDWRAARAARARRAVDTKASKGRRMRFAVHERLQNFMAPEDRGSWSARQADGLFGGLFGVRSRGAGGRGEDEDEESSDEEEGGEAALRLFRG